VRRIGGLGLGLSYCRRIIEDEFKGKISLNSWEVQKPQPRRFEGDNYITKVTVKLKLIEEDKDND
jgi:signal transduction histidine kinase